MTSLYRYLPAITVMTGIFIVSHIPGDELHTPLFPHFDKISHALEYFILAMTLVYARRPDFNQSRGVGIFLFCIFYAVTDELHQFFVPFRVTSIGDIAADSFGAFGALLLCNVINRWRNSS